MGKEKGKTYSDDIVELVLAEARYIIDTNGTIRTTADHFDRSKTTVFNDLRKKLKVIDNELYSKVDIMININKEMRYHRGGKALNKKRSLTTNKE